MSLGVMNPNESDESNKSPLPSSLPGEDLSEDLPTFDASRVTQWLFQPAVDPS